MLDDVDELQLLRLIKAFLKVTDPETRRLIVAYVEELARKQEMGRAQEDCETNF